jgi:hypothetical protein
MNAPKRRGVAGVGRSGRGVMKTMKLACALAGALALVGCTDMDSSWLGGRRANITAQYPVVDEHFERIDLVAALAGDAEDATQVRTRARAQAAMTPNPAGARDFPTGPTEVRVASIELSMAYRAFYARTNAMSEAAKRRERNRVQDQVFNASQLSCAIFKRNIRIQQEKSGFITGTATTVLGGLGAIFTSASTARALAGSAGITSGVGAEFRQVHFANLAAEVITAGIEAKRASIYDQIDKRRHDATNGSLGVYSMENAIHDTIRYHAACSIDVGFEAAKDAIQLTRNPGLNEAANVIERVQALRQKIQQIDADPESGSSGTAQSAASGRLASAASAGSLELGRLDLPLEVLTGYRQNAPQQATALYRILEGRIEDLRKLEVYRGSGKDAEFATALKEVADPIGHACTWLRNSVAALLDKDKTDNFSIRIAQKIAELDSDDARASVNPELRTLRWEAEKALVDPLVKLQSLWEIRSARMRATLLRSLDTNRLTEAKPEAKALQDEIVDFITKNLPDSKAPSTVDDACKPSSTSPLGLALAKAPGAQGQTDATRTTSNTGNQGGAVNAPTSVQQAPLPPPAQNRPTTTPAR